MFNRLTPVVKKLLLINIGLFFASYLIFAVLEIDVTRYLGYHYIFSNNFQVYQIVTYMFMHAGIWHLFLNMFGLLMFGSLLESFWGPKKFLIFYMVTGVGAGVLYGTVNYYELRPIQLAKEVYVENPNFEDFNTFVTEYSDNRIYNKLYNFIQEYGRNQQSQAYIDQSVVYVKDIYGFRSGIPMVGASGAIFGIIMAFGMLFPNTELMLLFPPIPIKAKYVVLFYGIYTVYNIIDNAPNDNVAHFAHLGGMVFAYVLIKIWQNDRKSFY